MTWTQRSKHLIGFVGTALLAGSLMAGCSSKPAPLEEEGAVAEETQAPLYNGLSLGEGLDVDPTPQGAPWPGTGTQCIGGNPTIAPLAVSSYVQTPEDLDESAHNQPFHRAFWVNAADGYETELRFAIEKQDGDGYNDYQDLDTVAANHYSEVFNQSEGPILSLLVVIPTADTNLEGAGDASDGCFGDAQGPDNFGDWVETCGIRYLREQKYGHYFLFSFLPEEAENVTAEPEQMWDFLTRRLQIGAYDNQSTEDAMAQIASRYPDLRFHVTGWDETTGSAPGLPEESAGVPELFLEFVDHYESAAEQAIQEDTLEGLGVPIWQYTPVYDAAGYVGELCQLEGDVTDAFICYQNVQDRVRYFTERIKPLIPIYLDAINNPADYKQPNESNEWNDYINGPYATAVNDIPTIVSNCEASLSSGDAQQICGACDPSSIRDASQAFGSLTYPQLAPNPNHPTAAGLNLSPFAVKSTDSPNEELLMHQNSGVCAWSFISGKLNDHYNTVGGGLTPTPFATWVLSAYSPNTSSSELITTRAYCTDQIVQGPNCGGQLCAWNELCVSGTCQYDNYYLLSVDQVSAVVSNSSTNKLLKPASGPDKPILGMAASISGNFRGLGEEMTVTHNPFSSPAEVDWESQQGAGMRGFSTAVTVKDPNQVPPQGTNFRDISINDNGSLDAQSNTISASSGQSVEVTIGSANQSFCYLTGVGGQFDGAGESIRLIERSGSWVLITRSTGVGDCNCNTFLGAPVACGCDSAKELRARARCIDYIQ